MTPDPSINDLKLLGDLARELLNGIDKSEVLTLMYGNIVFSAHKINGQLYTTSTEMTDPSSEEDMQEAIGWTLDACQSSILSHGK